jgi:hypothetical protein
MDNNSAKLWIGDRYSWGNLYANSSTLITGFFNDRNRSRNVVAMTMMPPPRYLDYFGSNLELVNDLICLHPVSENDIAEDKDHFDFYEKISSSKASPGMRCHMICPDDRRVEAIFVGNNRIVSLNGNVRRGLYELDATSSVAGMAGAPVISDGALYALIVGDGGKSGNRYRAFAVPTHGLEQRLSVIACTGVRHKSDNHRTLRNISDFEQVSPMTTAYNKAKTAERERNEYA